MKKILLVTVLAVFVSCGPHVKIVKPLSQKPQNERVLVSVIDVSKSKTESKSLASSLFTKPLVKTIARIKPAIVLRPHIKQTLKKSGVNYKFMFSSISPESTTNKKSAALKKHTLIMEFKIVRFLFQSKVDRVSGHLVRDLYIDIKCSLKDVSNENILWESLINEKINLNYLSFILVRNDGAKIKKLLADKVIKAIVELMKQFR